MERPHLEVVPPADLLKTVRLSELVMRSIVWLEKPLILGEAFTLVAGSKGVGKGTWLASQIAKRTTSAWGEPKNVLVVSSEDSATVDMLPRCFAAGADTDRVILVQDHFTLPHDKKKLYDTAIDIGDVGMIVLDPIGNHLNGANTDSEGHVRHAISDLNRMADKLGCAIFGVRHLGKARERGALGSVLGSTAWVDLPRAVLVFAADDEDELVFHVQMAAGNRTARNAGCSYRMELIDVGLGEPVTKAVLVGDSTKDVEDLLQTTTRVRNSKSGAARELILDVLEAVGSMESEAFDAKIATETGVSAKTVRNLRGELKNDGLVKSIPEKDEYGTVTRWLVARTAAPR